MCQIIFEGKQQKLIVLHLWVTCVYSYDVIVKP